MLVLQIKYNYKDAQGVEEITYPLRFPEKPSEITLRKWVDFQLQFDSLPNKLKQSDTSDWSEEDMMEYYSHQISLLKIFAETQFSDDPAWVPADFNDIAKLPITGKAKVIDNLTSLFTYLFKAINDYEPKVIEDFMYKGKKFTVPETYRSRFNIEKVGSNLSVIETVEALQLEHILQIGKESMPDYRYHNDIGVMACVCRMLDHRGTPETMPIETNARRKFIDNRCAFFADISMDIALDVGFFLAGSKKILKLMQELVTYTNQLQTLQEKQLTK